MKTVQEMTGQEALAAYKTAKDIIREQQVIVEGIKGHYKPLAVANGGKCIVYAGPDGEHGFEVAREEGRLSQRMLEQCLLDLKLTPDQIAYVKTNSKGAPGKNFSIF